LGSCEKCPVRGVHVVELHVAAQDFRRIPRRIKAGREKTYFLVETRLVDRLLRLGHAMRRRWATTVAGREDETDEQHLALAIRESQRFFILRRQRELRRSPNDGQPRPCLG